MFRVILLSISTRKRENINLFSIKKRQKMNTAELKNHLHKLIVDTNDIEVLTKIESYFSKLKTKDVDWWGELSENSKRDIEEGIEQADNGGLIDHKEARKSIDSFFKKHA